METTASEAPRAARRFTVIDLLGQRYAVTEFVHRDPSRAAYRSYRLDSGEWLNRWDDEGTLICMRSGTLLRRLETLPRGARRAQPKPVAKPPATSALACGA